MRNVVVVTIDSLRADHCGFMGYDRETTPTLDSMASDGLVFENAIAPGPSTPESMPAIFTGHYPVNREGEFASRFSRRQTCLYQHMRAHDTLPERFARAGYATAGFSPNPYTSRYFGFDAGFDTYQDFLDGSRKRLYDGVLDGAFEGATLRTLFPARIILNSLGREEVFKPWEAFYDRILQWVRRAAEPYFLWVLLMDTHDPYLAPERFRTQSRWGMYHANWRLWRQGHDPPIDNRTHNRLIRAYDDSIRYADSFLDRIRSDLTDDDPIMVVHGDHGEAFGEHGTYGHQPYLYEENIHVPFVIDGISDRTIDSPVSLRRLPEFLPAVARNDHLSINGIPTKSRSADGDRMAVRGVGWKYLHGPDGDEFYVLGDGERSQPERTELRRLGRRIAEDWLETETERRRIESAVRQIIRDR